jgi:hypothetical protein
LLPVLILPALLSFPTPVAGSKDPGPRVSQRRLIRIIGRVKIRPVPGRRPVYSIEKIEKLLRPFVGGEWDPGEIETLLEDRYRFLGYLPRVRATVQAGILDIRIRESRFLLKLITRDPNELSRIGILPRRGSTDPFPDDPEIPDWILQQNLLAGPGDYDNLERYAQERYRLARFGYDIAFIAGVPDPDTGFDSGAYLLVPRGQGGRAGVESVEKLPPDRNYLGGSASYGPRRGTTVRATYRRWKWLTPFDFLEVSPEYNTEFGGEIRYRTDYLFPERFAHRNVSFSVRLFSELIPNRVIAGQETDERTEGGRVFFGIGLVPEKKSHDLELGLEFERSNLDLSGDFLAPVVDDFAFLRLTSRYTYRHLYRPPRFQLRALPALVLSLDKLGGEVAYELLSVDANLHGFSFHRYQLDFHLIGGVMGGDVPLTQELRIGGANTVRGFEEEDFSGTRMIAVQSELWFPLAPERPAGPRFLSRLMGAVFLDAGLIGGGRQGPSGEPVGAGFGLRYTLSGRPFFVKLDYGIGIHDGGDDHFYMSIGFHY